MSKLSNLASSKIKVKLNGFSGVEVTVKGLSISNISSLLESYPDLLEAMSGKNTVDIATTITRIPGAVVDILSLTCSADMDEEDIASLGVNDALDLIIGVVEATFPGGMDPFLKKMEGLAKVMEKKA